MIAKKIVGSVGLGLSLLAAACSGGTHDATDSSEGAATASSCRDTSPTPCTPAVGSDLRKGIADLLRFSLSGDLSKNGVEPGDADVKFVFKTMLIQQSHIYAAATIMRGDGTTPFDLTGTKLAGKSNTVQSLMEVESGSEFSHQIGIGLDPKAFACDFVNANFDVQAPQIYQGNMKSDCAALGGSKSVDDACAVSYSQAAGACNDLSGGDDAKFDACLVPVKAHLQSCCDDGGSANCTNP
jgi:hypothetical protein